MKNWLDDMGLTVDQLATASLAGTAVFLLGTAVFLLVRHQRERSLARMRSRGEEPGSRESSSSSRVVQSLSSVGQRASSGQFSSSLQRQLARAGYPSPSAPAVYVGAKIVVFLIGISLAAILGLLLRTSFQNCLLLIVAAGVVAFLLPNLHVHRRQQRRYHEIRTRLPDAVDLLEICVSSGMGLDMAWNAVSQEIQRVSTTLADEMELTRLEIHLGVPRTEAMRHMAERTGVEDISSLVALLVQSDRFGASIVHALETFATTMRDVQSKRAEESAEKMAVKLIFPMVLFIFPTLFLVMVGPAVMRIVDVMG